MIPRCGFSSNLSFLFMVTSRDYWIYDTQPGWHTKHKQHHDVQGVCPCYGYLLLGVPKQQIHRIKVPSQHLQGFQVQQAICPLCLQEKSVPGLLRLLLLWFLLLNQEWGRSMEIHMNKTPPYLIVKCCESQAIYGWTDGSLLTAGSLTVEVIQVAEMRVK